MNGTILAYCHNRAVVGGWLDRIAVVEEESGTEFSHREIFTAATHLAAELRSCGVGAGVRIGLRMNDCAAWTVSFLGCSEVGAVPVLINPDLRSETIVGQYATCDVEYELVLSNAAIVLRSRTQRCAMGMWDLADLLLVPVIATRAASLTPALAYIQFTSGTTGAPKAIPHRAADLGFYFAAVCGPDRLDIGVEDVIVSVSQSYFAYGFNNQFVYPMFSGCRVVVRARRRRPDDVVATLRRYPATLLFSVPSALAGLTAPSDWGSPTLRGIISAGESLAERVESRVRDEWAVPVLEQIGCTEVGNAFCANGFGSSSTRSAGLVCDGYDVDVRPGGQSGMWGVRAPHGRTVGEIWVAGPTVPATADTCSGSVSLLTDGWLQTNDYGYWNATGGLVVLGRRDDILLIGGICSPAVPVEAEIRGCPGVSDAAVVESQDDRGASTVVALVVSDTPDDVLASELQLYLRGRVERFEIPRRVVRVREIPRSPSGKIRRHALRRLTEADT